MSTFQFTVKISSAIFSLAISSSVIGSDLIVNEWNCVGGTKWLGNPSSATASCPSPDGIGGAACSTEEDVYFGRSLGNGGDWIEIVINKDHTDIRGWKLQWIEAAGKDTDGTDVWYGDGAIPQGEIVFSGAAIWSDLRAGTILTIIERPTALGGLDTDTSFNPCNGDWWINVNCFDATLVTCNANVVDPQNPTYNDPMDVGNDNWASRIVNAQGQIVIDLVGEGQPSWGGTGVSSREVVRLEESPSQAITPYSRYDDSDSSSFGQPNGWSDTVTQCKTYQDFSVLRSPVLAELCQMCKPIILNEFNAVSATGFLGGGTQTDDAAGGQASDPQFGRSLGNGGNWCEFVIIAENLDMRNWILRWQDKTDSGTIRLSNNTFWSNLPSGMILTFTESTATQGGVNTDLSYNPSAGDRSVNVNTFDTTLISQTTSTKPLHTSGEFSVSNDRWAIEVRDQSFAPIVELQGEGSPNYFGGGVGSDDVCRLRANPSGRIDAASFYDDSSTSSTFGKQNSWVSCPSSAVVTQSFVGLPQAGCVWETENPADINGDGFVNGSDLATLLSTWGTTDVNADLNNDGIVSGPDLAVILSAWTSQ
ncbi:MAG: hypothetical protein O2875_07710 [Planctomycetota bacterium]|nr:hypothetical protein [Planctomycetota bacterium]